MIIRTLSFSVRLSRATHADLAGFLDEMRNLWNAALQERIDACRKAGKFITWMDQFKSLTEIRRDIDGYDNYPVASQRSVVQRLDRAVLKRCQRILSRPIHEQTWGAFVQMLSYKAEEAGGWVRKAPSHHTLQRCSRSGRFPTRSSPWRCAPTAVRVAAMSRIAT